MRQLLVAASLVLFLGGLIVALSLAGVPALAELSYVWRRELGVAALPATAGLVAGGIALYRNRSDPWTLPWSRLAAAETAALAALVLLAAAAGPTGPSELGPGGHIGWAFLSITEKALGRFSAIAGWLLVGAVASVGAAGISVADLARRLGAYGYLRSSAEMDEPAPDRRTDATGGSAAARGQRKPSASTEGKQSPRRRYPTRSGGRTTRTGGPSTPSRSRAKKRSDHLPRLSILGQEGPDKAEEAGLQAIAERIEGTLASFGVPAHVVEIERGPAVTRFGLHPGTIERGGVSRRVSVRKIRARKDDLALALAASSIRIEAPVPGRSYIGLEIPNPEICSVGLRGLLESEEFERECRKSPLTVALGRDVSGQPVVADLAAMPHLLIAGATGSGKSVCLHGLLASLLFQNTPDTLRLILIDPKRVEFSRYKGLGHIIGQVVTEIPETIGVLKWCARHMDRRYQEFSERGVRDLAAYNARSPAGEAPMPAQVVMIDELADPMLVAPGETEPLVQRIAQLGRATGIHLVVATQRPSTDVITGVIKANFPARIAFAVASSVDSRVVLDSQGAETLLGGGDALYRAPDAARPRRLQGTFVADDEIERLVRFWRESPWTTDSAAAPWSGDVMPLSPDERLYEAALRLAESESDLNASLLQRRLRIGYGKARELMDRLEDEGVAS